MKLPEEFLSHFVEESENLFKNYERTPYMSEEDIIKETSDLYDGKNVYVVKNIYSIENILKDLENPFVYHYSFNLNWIVLFNRLYQKMWVHDYIKEGEDLEVIYLKTCRLEIIFNHFDGIIEKENDIYLIKDDFNLIKNNITRWKI